MPTRATSLPALLRNADEGVENIARLRRAKRFAGLCAVKRSPAYILTVSRRGRQRPRSPDPYDLSLSKRSWEKSMQDWRASLRKILHQIHREDAKDI